MKVSDLFQDLSLQELSNLSLSGEGSGEIEFSKQNMIVGYTNAALLRLHTRFFLKENFITLEMVEDVTDYKLTSEHAVSNTTVGPTKYIIDSDCCIFDDDILKIMRVVDDCGRVYQINDSDSCNIVTTPKPDVLRIMRPMAGRKMTIFYQAKHDKLEFGVLNAEIDIPDVLHEALRSYIAHLTFNNMNGQENAARAQIHLNKYDSICQEIRDMDLMNARASMTTHKFHDRGWC